MLTAYGRIFQGTRLPSPLPTQINSFFKQNKDAVIGKGMNDFLDRHELPKEKKKTYIEYPLRIIFPDHIRLGFQPENWNRCINKTRQNLAVGGGGRAHISSRRTEA